MTSFFCLSKCIPLLFIVTAFVVVPTSSFADATTPKRGSEERKAILDAVRKPLQSALNQKVIFVVDHLKVDGDWAFLRARPKTKDGGPINYAETKYAEEAREADELTVALLQKVKGTWILIEHGYFTTDVWWENLWKQHKGCPESIFVEKAG